MKTRLQRVVAASVLCNVILTAMLCWAYGRLQRAQQELTHQNGTAPEKRPDKTSAERNGPTVRFDDRGIDWRKLESSDYRKYIQNLRSVGCPESTVRDIIIADVNQLFDAKRKALTGVAKPVPYWKSSPAARFAKPPVDETTLRSLKILDKERRDVIKELLGVDMPADDDYLVKFYVNPNTYVLDFLPPGKRASVLSLQEERNARLSKLTPNGATGDAAVAKALNDVQKAFEQQLAGVLTPEEFREYQLRLSPTADKLTLQFYGFEPTEQEYVKMFDLQKAFDDKFGVHRADRMTADEFERYDPARRERDEKIKEVLGSERFEEYQREGHYQFRSLVGQLNRQELPKQSAVKVWEIKQVAEEQIRKLGQDQALSHEQRRSAGQAISVETEKALVETIGTDALQSLRKSPTAQWLRNLSPQPDIR